MTTVEAIRRRQRETNVLLTAVLIVLLAAGAYQFAHVNPQNADTTSALCSLRDNIASRAADSQDFLKKHPHGIPGITPAVIEAGVKRDENAVEALSGLPCS